MVETLLPFYFMRFLELTLEDAEQMRKELEGTEHLELPQLMYKPVKTDVYICFSREDMKSLVKLIYTNLEYMLPTIIEFHDERY